MKHFYLILCLLLISSNLFSQLKPTNEKLGKVPQEFKKTPVKQIKNITESRDKAIIFTEDFSTGMGAWAATGTDAFIWQYDLDGPNGEYSDPVTQIITSPTAGNGFMIFDADLSNTPGGASDRSGELMSPVINLSGKTQISIDFYHTYRWCCSGAFYPKVEVSTDGFLTFTEFNVSTAGVAVNDDAPTTKYTINLASFLAGATNLNNFQFRFNFDGITNSASHYFWQVDDIELYDTPSFDLKLNEVIWGSTGWIMTPTYKVPDFQIAPVYFGGVVNNIGASDQNDATFDATSGVDFSGTSGPVFIAGNTIDTLWTGAVTLPTTNAIYPVVFEVSSSNTDATPSDNFGTSFNIEVNPNILSVNTGIPDGTGDYNGQAYEAGNVFNIPANGSLVSAEVAISGTSNPGAQIYARLYQIDQAAGDLASAMIEVATSNLYTILAGDLGAQVSIPFITPYSLTAGESYALLIGSSGDGGATNDFSYRTAGFSEPTRSLFYDTGGSIWYYTTSTPMVDMNIAQFTTPIITSSDGDNTVCSGQTVTLTSSEASGNVWSTGATTQSITVSASGSYTVTANGLTSLATTVNVISVPTPSITTSGATTFCDGGSVTLTSSSPTGNTWSTSATTQSISVSTSGNYTVTRTLSGCTATSTITAVSVLAAPATPTISASGPTSFCSGGSVILTSSAASNNTWSNGSTSQSITVSSTGSYTVTNTVSGCSATSGVTNVNVTANPSTPTITASGATTFCSGQSITLTSSAASGNLWSTGAVTQAITVSATGNYSVTQTVSGCSATSSILPVTVNTTPATPTISASGPTTFCSGSSVILTSSSAINNFWNTGATSQSITVSSAGNYLVTVSANGCSASSAMTGITVNTSPVISLGTVINPVSCGSTTGSLQVNGSGTGNVSWSGTVSGLAPGVSFPYTITGLGAGSYAVSFLDGNGCTSNTLTPSLSDPGAPAAPLISSSSSTTFCIGGNVILTSSSATGNTWSTGATTQSITVSTAGSYFVTNTVAGCSSTSTATTVVVNSLPTVNAGTYTAACQNAADVVLNAASPTGGTFSGTGVSGSNFDPSVGTQSITYLFTDVNGCTNSSVATINVLSLPAVNAGVDQNICPGGSVTLTGAGAPTLSWDQGVIDGVSFAPSSTGNYTLTGIGANGCSNIDFVTVTIVALPVIASGTITSPSTCGSATGSIQITGTGTGNLSWSGSASGTLSGITLPTTAPNLGAGTYTFIFTSSIGCPSNSLIQSLSDPGAPASPTITASGSTTFCAGNTVTLTSSAASGNLWSTGETTSSITVSTSGSYSVAITVAGCSANSAATVVTVNANPVISLGSVSNPTVCGTATGSIQVTGTGTGNLTWSGTASGSLSNATLPLTISNLASGSYSVSFNDGCASNVLTSSLSDVGITVPIITATGGTTFCAGGSVTLVSSVASGITWSNGATSQSIVVSASGSYVVTNTAGACTANSLPTVVTVNSNPTVNAGTDVAICAGDQVTLTATATDPITWSGSVVDGVAFTPPSTNTYTATATNGGGCTATDVVTVTVNAVPNIIGSATNPTSCSGTNGNIVVNGTGTGNISWTGTASGSSAGITLPFTIPGLTAGSYTINFISGAGCNSNTVFQTLTDPGAPTPPIITTSGATTFCQGSSVTLTSSDVTGITWSTGETTPSITVSSTGNYSVSLNVGGCVSVSNSLTVTVNPNPVIALGTTSNPTSCSTLTGSIQVTGTGTGDLSWTGTAAGSQTNVALPFVITGLGSGTYTISFDNGCVSNSISGGLSDPGAPATPVITASGSTAICSGSSITLTSSSATGIVWSTGETTATITVSTAGDYFVTASSGGCNSSSSILTVVVNANPTIDAGIDATICEGTTATLAATTTATISWDKGVLDGIAFTPTATDVYTATATDGNGCTATDQATITVTPLPVITFDAIAQVCVYNSPVALIATPTGGVFSGTGVSGTNFDPTGIAVGTYTITYDVTVSACSSSATQTVVVDSCLGINSLSQELISIYPNPVNGQINISGDHLTDFDFVAIKDQLGRIVISQQAISANLHEIDLSKLANGSYFLIISAENKQQTYKVEVLK